MMNHYRITQDFYPWLPHMYLYGYATVHAASFPVQALEWDTYLVSNPDSSHLWNGTGLHSGDKDGVPYLPPTNHLKVQRRVSPSTILGRGMEAKRT